MNSKSFFFCAAAIGILIIGSDKIYRLWQMRHDEQILQTQLRENRKRMDKFYAAKFERIYKDYMNSQRAWLQGVWLDNSIKATENKMIQDGYSNAEAGFIQQQALSRINSYNV